MKLRWKSAPVLAGAVWMLLACVPGAHADTTEAFKLTGVQPNSTVLSVSDNSGTTWISGYVGEYNATLNGPAPGGLGPFSVFCVDLHHDIHVGNTYTADVSHAITDAPGALVGNYYDGGLGSALNSSDDGVTGLTDAQKSARSSEVAWLSDNYLGLTSFTGVSGSTNVLNNMVAINLSIWDILQDGGNGLHTGTMQAQSTSYDGLFTYYLNQAAANANYKSTTALWIQAPITVSGSNYSHLQTYVYEQGGIHPHLTSTPEPGPMAMLASLSFVIAGIILRKRRQIASLSA